MSKEIPLTEVKAGDKVLVLKSVRITPYKSKTFMVKAMVDRTTRTQLWVAGERYQRRSGFSIPYAFNNKVQAYKASDDHTDRYDDLTQKVEWVATIDYFEIDIGTDHPMLEDIAALLKLASKLAKSVEKYE